MKTSTIRLTEFQRHVVVGTLLGDSSLSCPANGKNFHLSCYHAIKQSSWLERKHEWLTPVSRPIQWCSYLDKRDGKTREGGRFHTVSIPCFTNLAQILYTRTRKKIISGEYLSLFNHPVSLACLIGDDGSWDGAGIAIASKQFTADENRRLAKHLATTFELSAKVNANGSYPYIRIPAASIGRIKELCKPWLPSVLFYKLGPEGWRTMLTGKVAVDCAACGTTFSTYTSAHQRFCSRACSSKDKPSAWPMRRQRYGLSGHR